MGSDRIARLSLFWSGRHVDDRNKVKSLGSIYEACAIRPADQNVPESVARPRSLSSDNWIDRKAPSASIPRYVSISAPRLQALRDVVEVDAR
jgi:hypothetical protein